MKQDSIALLPLDNRPVSYLLPKQIADFSGINLILPERKCLGDLKCGSDLDYIDRWLKDTVETYGHTSLTLIISLDSFIYGGLVQSRKHDLSLEELKNRCRGMPWHVSTVETYGFSSIMRIPNYNNSDEEKDYWKDYGEKIFKWSELTHKVGDKNAVASRDLPLLIEDWYQSSKEIPSNIIADYKAHREKNLTVNILWLESLHESCFEYLIFSCDDSGKYGMNVVEAEYIKKQIKNHNFLNKVKVLSGTDEIPLILLTKAVLKKSVYKPSVSLYFNSVEGKNQLARYESNTIYNSVLNQIETLGVEVKDFKDSEIALFVHCADSVQGDHIFKVNPSYTKNNANELIKVLEKSDKPFVLFDLAYANGADPNLIEALLSSKMNMDKCYGYSGWNTCSNSIGSALAIGINRWIAEKGKSFDELAFKKCLLTRFLDDYAYQAKIRHKKVTEKEVNEKMKPYVKRFLELLNLNNIEIQFKLPWKRAFEIEVKIN